MKRNLLKLFLCLMAFFACAPDAWGEINWLAQGEVPVAGKKYYIFNADHNYFVTYATTDATATLPLAGTTNPSEAKPLTFEEGASASQFIISIDDNGTNKTLYSASAYPYEYDYYGETVTTYYGLSCEIQDGEDTGGYETYYIKLPSTTSTRTYTLDTYSATNLKPSQSYKNWRGRNWVFIPEDAFWKAQGVFPEVGNSYYIYNADHNYFVTYATTDATATLPLAGTTNPSEAKPLTFEEGASASQFIISIDDNGTNKTLYSASAYPYEYDYYGETVTTYYGLTCEIQDGEDTGGYETYYIKLPSTTSTRTYTLDTYSATNLKPSQSYKNWRGRNWVFIPEGAIIPEEAQTFYGRMDFITDTAAVKRGGIFYDDYKYYYARSSYSFSSVARAHSVTSDTRQLECKTLRGYRFIEWQTSSNVIFNASDGKYDTRAVVKMTTSSTDSEHPDVATIQAVYDTLPKLTLSLQKAADRGGVTVQYENFLPANASSLSRQTVNLTPLATSETSRDYAVYGSDLITMVATAERGYEFSGWYVVNGNGENVFVTNNTTLVLPGDYANKHYEADSTYIAFFNRPLSDKDKYLVGQSPCQTFEQALAAASSMSTKTILQLKDDTIPAGSYTIPADVTLLIPCDAEQADPTYRIQRVTNGTQPSAFRTLTLADGVHLNVYGVIEVSGKQIIDECPSRTIGSYGYMVMQEGSSIVLNNGATLRAWGFVTGNGEIDARRGATVREPFQMRDWKGTLATQNMFGSPNDVYKVLPVNQYFVQNIEVPTIYHPGSKLLTCAAVSLLWRAINVEDVGVIGVRYSEAAHNADPGLKDDLSIFLMDNEDESDDTWVRKYYDVEHDKQVYEINNSAYLGSLVVSIAGIGAVNSTEYKLPITSNFKIHLLNGQMQITQDTEILPGAEIEINKKATMYVNPGARLWFWDADNWGKYVYDRRENDEFKFEYATHIKYRPGVTPDNTVRDISSPAAIGDAKLIVHGTVNVQGELKTTEGGSSIMSYISDAGTVTFSVSAPAESEDDKIWQVTSASASVTPNYESTHCSPAKLKNDEGSRRGAFSPTANTSEGQSYCFVDIDNDGKGEWILLTYQECFAYDQYNVWYIKPSAYVAIHQGTNEPAPETDHTYRDHYAGTDSIYIQTEGCQWWCVYPVEGHPDLFECRHPNNHTYYYWNGSKWAEKKFKVSWQNWDGSPVNYTNSQNEVVNYYMVTYGTVPKWLSTNPTRVADDSHTYDFIGWSPTPKAVTEDVIYTAQYDERDKMYEVGFYDKDGTTPIEVIYCKLGEMPVCGSYTLAEGEEWTPALGPVTANGQTYTLRDIDTEKTTFTITWQNWNGGDPIRTDEDQTEMLAWPAIPTKADDATHSYTFDKWVPTPPTAGTALTADAVYTATYTAGPKKYAIKFYQENGTTQIGETQNVAHGAMPEVPEYGKDATAAKTYTLVWSPLLTAATGNQDYIATFTEATRKYLVTWKDGNGNTLDTKYFDYNTTPVYVGVTPTKAMDAEHAYSFNGTWKLGEAEASDNFAAVTSDQVYVAQFDALDRSLEVNNNDAETISKSTSVYEVIVHNGGKVTSEPGAVLTADVLTLEADANGSGQLIAANANITTANFDLTLNAVAEKWYAFGVPWSVNLNTDPIVEVGGTNRTFVLGRDYDIIVYNGAKRATSGAGYWCWEFVENKGKILTPGQGYMIRFLSDVTTIRFAKEAGAPVIYNGVFNLEENASANNMNAGWNAMANPMPYHAVLEGPATGYIYNPNDDNYSAYDIEDGRFIVGKAVYVQTVAATSVIVNPAGDAGDFVAAAPARRTKATDKKYMQLRDYYQVAIASTTTEGGHVYVLPEEGKENKYVIGHDLAQFGMSAAIPQVWVNRYDTKLALNTTALNNETAEFPMGVYAPNAGEYTISLNAQPSDEYNVYLTRDGQAIWNLSDGAFTADLKAGIQSNYGLRLTVNKAPQVVTGIDEAIVHANGETRKVMINNQVYIIRGEQVYTIDGQLVK